MGDETSQAIENEAEANGSSQKTGCGQQGQIHRTQSSFKEAVSDPQRAKSRN
jgi:hypothetical protein